MQARIKEAAIAVPLIGRSRRAVLAGAKLVLQSRWMAESYAEELAAAFEDKQHRSRETVFGVLPCRAGSNFPPYRLEAFHEVATNRP